MLPEDFNFNDYSYDQESNIAALFWAPYLRNAYKLFSLDGTSSHRISMFREEQIMNFGLGLVEVIREESLRQITDDFSFIEIRNDYTPQGILAEACTKQGIFSGWTMLFPQKVSVIIKPGLVYSQHGDFIQPMFISETLRPQLRLIAEREFRNTDVKSTNGYRKISWNTILPLFSYGLM